MGFEEISQLSLAYIEDIPQFSDLLLAIIELIPSHIFKVIIGNNWRNYFFYYVFFLYFLKSKSYNFLSVVSFVFLNNF